MLNMVNDGIVENNAKGYRKKNKMLNVKLKDQIPQDVIGRRIEVRNIIVGVENRCMLSIWCPPSLQYSAASDVIL